MENAKLCIWKIQEGNFSKLVSIILYSCSSKSNVIIAAVPSIHRPPVESARRELIRDRKQLVAEKFIIVVAFIFLIDGKTDY